ncbi:hypothetical protein [Paenibacillus illinoisensis]|uniref:hypothetical protein n=1 Tax=Paenibacillus TaxID=44249 RepID=UPI001C8E066C|nr:hypothetical protein [Paenibacillus illinoisensis]MBY0218530.1 hypothetical protein [Paenibacillus illinoisensis]MCM3205240.1 hypothetical protein [Paenibacillus illinoisensis]
MLIILAVIVILGVIFLMIFNSRSTRRAAEARAAQTAETEREPVLLHGDEQTEGQLLDSSDPVEYTEPDGLRETETELRENKIEVSHQARQQETQTKGNDSEYRQALLHFRKPPEPQEEPVESTSNEIEKSADEIYRSALRDMKSKSSPPDSDPK